MDLLSSLDMKRQAQKDFVLSQFDRAAKRRLKHIDLPSTADALNETAIDSTESGITTKNASVQVHFNLNSDIFEFSSSFDKNDCGTQCNIVVNDYVIFKKDAGCGTGNDICKGGIHGYENICDDSESLMELTNISVDNFQLLLSLISEESFRALPNATVLLLFLIKMKKGISFTCLGTFFNVHRSTAMRMFTKVLESLCIKTKNYIFWPSKSAVEATLPKAFKELYPDARAIINCIEIKTETPPRADMENMYSSYELTYTFKFLVGVTPNGFISFISKCYGGRHSDSFIANESGFLDILGKGDVILADKGFSGIKIEDAAIIVMPPIQRFTEQETLHTESIASSRIHIERCIQQMKQFQIMEFVPIELFRHVDNIVRMCCVLANLANFLPHVTEERTE